MDLGKKPEIGYNKKMKYRNGIVDIDGTLISKWGQPFKINQEVVDFVKENIHNVIIVTGRKESEYKAKTEGLLDLLGIEPVALYMNPYGPEEADKYKESVANHLSNMKVSIAIDDNPDTRAIYESFGIKTIDPESIS